MADPKDYRTEVYRLLNDPRKNFIALSSMDNARRIIQLLLKYGPIIEEKMFKNIYDCLVGGDPKRRTLRAIITQINCDYSKLGKGTRKNAE
jgi:hypothetical protein